MLPGGTLGYMRAMTNRLLTDTCTIQARASGRGEFGNAQQTAWQTVATGVQCRVINLQAWLAGGAETVAGREAVTDIYRLICPAGTALDADQRVTLSDGTVFHVVDVKVSLTDETDTQATIARVR